MSLVPGRDITMKGFGSMTVPEDGYVTVKGPWRVKSAEVENDLAEGERQRVLKGDTIYYLDGGAVKYTPDEK